MRRGPLVMIGVSIATVAALRATPDEVLASEDGVVIELDESSRFEFAVAGTVQFQDDTPTPVRPTPSVTLRPQGSTIDLSPPPAGPPGPTTSSGVVIIRNAQTPHGQRGMAALDSIDYPWRDALEGWIIVFLPGRSDRSGLVDFGRRTIEISVRSNHTDEKLAHVMAHEIGHVVDWRFVTDAERRGWINARGLGNRSWYPSSGTFDFSSPAGDFAEAFAVWQVGGRSYSQIGGPFSEADLALVAQLSKPG